MCALLDDIASTQSGNPSTISALLQAAGKVVPDQPAAGAAPAVLPSAPRSPWPMTAEARTARNQMLLGYANRAPAAQPQAPRLGFADRVAQARASRLGQVSAGDVVAQQQQERDRMAAQAAAQKPTCGGGSQPAGASDTPPAYHWEGT